MVRFPLEVVFRIYDNILANGIEAIFMFSINLLKKNEEVLLSLKFDDILAFLNNKLFDCYLVSFSCFISQPYLIDHDRSLTEVLKEKMVVLGIGWTNLCRTLCRYE